MTVRRWFCVAVLLILSSGSGCQSWCARHYPCQQPAAYPAYGYGAPAASVPCVPCCPPSSGYPAAAPTWNAPQPVACPPGCRPG